MIHVRAVPAADTRPLRQRVLRPHQRPDEIVLAGDDDPAARHIGAWLDGDGPCVGVGSICPDPEAPGGAVWRVRGMATDAAARGQGVGRAVLEALLAHGWASGATRIWCTARTTAAGFYLRQGFEVEGEPFELPQIGPHVVMRAPRP